MTANGTSTATVTVTAKDANDNTLTASGGTVTLAATSGSLSAVTDNHDGTYTATLTAPTTTGTATITGTIAGSAIGHPTTITYTPGAVDATSSTVTASPSAVTADGSTASLVTVTAKDAYGNAVPGQAVALAQGLGHSTITTTTGTTNGSGVFTTTVKSTVAETDTYSATIGATPLLATASVSFTPGTPSATQSTFVALPTSIVADGTSTSTLKVTLKDAFGNVVPGTHVSISQGTGSSTIAAASGVTNGAGAFSTTVSTTTAQSVTYTAIDTDDLLTLTQQPTVSFGPGALSAAHSTITAAPGSITADGASTSTITVRAKDVNDNTLAASAGGVTLATTSGSLSAVTDNHDGTYTATLTSSTQVGTASVTGTIAGTAIGHPTTVAFAPGTLSPAHTVIAASPASLTADGSSTATITVTAKDTNDNNRGASGGLVSLSTDLGTLGPVTDHGDGTYTATFTAATVTGTAHITGTIAGVAIGHAATVSLVPGPADAAHTVISATPGTLAANGTATAAILVQAEDAHGNLLTASGGAVSLSATIGSLSGVTDNHDGTYTATYTAPTAAGTASISGTIGGAAIGHPASVTLTPGPANAASSQLSGAPLTVGADGTAASTLTVQARDANSNNLTSGGATVVFATDHGTLGSVVDHGNGTYTTTLVDTTAGFDHVTATLNGSAVPGTVSVHFLPSTSPNGSKSTISASPSTVTADGVSAAQVTVQARDVNNNPLVTGGATVVLATSRGTLGTVADNGDGTYTATLTSTTAGTATVTGTINGVAIGQPATVSFVPGPVSASHSTVVAATGTGSTDSGTRGRHRDRARRPGQPDRRRERDARPRRQLGNRRPAVRNDHGRRRPRGLPRQRHGRRVGRQLRDDQRHARQPDRVDRVPAGNRREPGLRPAGDDDGRGRDDRSRRDRPHPRPARQPDGEHGCRDALDQERHGNRRRHARRNDHADGARRRRDVRRPRDREGGNRIPADRAGGEHRLRRRLQLLRDRRRGERCPLDDHRRTPSIIADGTGTTTLTVQARDANDNDLTTGGAPSPSPRRSAARWAPSRTTTTAPTRRRSPPAPRAAPPTSPER